MSALDDYKREIDTLKAALAKLEQFYARRAQGASARAVGRELIEVVNSLDEVKRHLQVYLMVETMPEFAEEGEEGSSPRTSPHKGTVLPQTPDTILPPSSPKRASPKRASPKRASPKRNDSEWMGFRLPGGFSAMTGVPASMTVGQVKEDIKDNWAKMPVSEQVFTLRGRVLGDNELLVGAWRSVSAVPPPKGGNDEVIVTRRGGTFAIPLPGGSFALPLPGAQSTGYGGYGPIPLPAAGSILPPRAASPARSATPARSALPSSPRKAAILPPASQSILPPASARAASPQRRVLPLPSYRQ
ncbi:Hypothetical protein POVN_LOCUS93 [uncultured virus]|nr:Hypothetical protein POVN_LOCUS93 [uncultured virus]